MQVLLEAGEQPIVLEQRVVAAQVCVKLVVGLLQDRPGPGAAVFQLLPKGRRDREAQTSPAAPSLSPNRERPSPPGLREGNGGFPGGTE